jgi:hypothetical protein
MRTRNVTRTRQALALVFVAIVVLTVVGCGNDAPSPSAAYVFPTFAPFPSSHAGASTGTTDLSAIACATADPTDVGELTGAWEGSEGGMYWIRQVGDCVWWFGTEVKDIKRGVTGQPGFANVASGRINGTRIDVEFADLPLGDVMGGAGLTLVYDAEQDQLKIVEQRGDWQTFGARTFTRIEPDASPRASPGASPSESASP